MSDNVLLDMSRMIGEIHGTLKAMETRHDQTMETLTKHDERITDLETTKHKAHGLALGLGAVAGFVSSNLHNFFGMFK